MSLVAQITSMPRPFQKERAEETVARVDISDPLARDLLIGAAGCSPYLASLIEKEADWLPGALHEPDKALDDATGLRGLADAALPSRLRQAKRRVALLVALADLGGVWPLERVTEALTRFADAACEAALTDALAEQRRRGKLPEDDVGLFVLAMGKMGAFELNYSSDIDLICLFDETRHDPSDYPAIRSACVKAVQRMCATLSDLTEEGYVFRTDLRLRPDPAVTPVVLSAGAAERYYESLGRTWERAAYIKARPCAGDIAAGEAFLDGLRPFVWRRHLDFATVQDAHDMRLAIRAHKGTGGPITLPGHNMKLGRGGIREIEFFTQTRQLIAGGRDPSLRMRGTVPALAHLASKGWISDAQSGRLADHYRFARTVEHRVQMVQDAQTHTLPKDEAGFERLAAMMDMQVDTLRSTLFDRLSEVHAETEGFFAPDTQSPSGTADIDPAIQARWRSYPALRSARGAALFDRIEPMLMERLNEAPRPHEALLALDGFLAGLPAGVQLFSLFEANPSLVDLLIDIVSISPALARYLSRNAQVLDAVLAGDFFAPWPGPDALREDVAGRLQAVADYEAKLDTIRVWAKEWHFRVGVHVLRSLVSAQEAGAQYADLATACVAALWPEVTAHFAQRHGPPPGRGAVVLGMGSLGAGRLTPGSDLDLIVIYDADGADTSEGKRPLPARTYYARLTQAMITAITAQTAQGRLYEADMRLRPSGNQGPVATSWAAFQSYQRTDAWFWEHLALTRARAIAGPASLAADIEAFRRDLLAAPRAPQEMLTELSGMRKRIAAAKDTGTLWQVKVGPGRLQDIELLSQAGALLAGRPSRAVSAGLEACAASGLISEAEAAALLQAYGLMSRVQMVARLLGAGAFDPAAIGAGGQGILLRATQTERLDAAEAKLAEAYEASARIIDAALADHAETDG